MTRGPVTPTGTDEHASAPPAVTPPTAGQEPDTAVTDTGPFPYATGPPPVTCVRCREVIDAADTLVLIGYRRIGSGVGAAAVCIPCSQQDRYTWPWYWTGRPRDEYGPRPCRHCGRRFYGELARRYCCDACGELARRERRPSRARPAYLARCVECDALYVPARADARYCSPACRQSAYRRRKADR